MKKLLLLLLLSYYISPCRAQIDCAIGQTQNYVKDVYKEEKLVFGKDNDGEKTVSYHCDDYDAFYIFNKYSHLCESSAFTIRNKELLNWYVNHLISQLVTNG